MKIETIKSLAESGAYRDRPSRDGQWYLNAELITKAIYGQSVYDREAQADALLEGETFKIFELNAWICTDTHVGLTMIEMNGEPIGITWQSGRKAEETLMFLTPETRAAFIQVWDRYTVAPEAGLNVLDNAQFSIPVAGVDQPRFEMCGGDAPYLDAVGAARVLDHLTKGEFETDDPALLSSMITALEERISQNNGAKARFDEMIKKPTPHLTEEKREKILKDIAEQNQKRAAENDQIRTEMIPEIQRRIDALTSSPSP